MEIMIIIEYNFLEDRPTIERMALFLKGGGDNISTDRGSELLLLIIKG